MNITSRQNLLFLCVIGIGIFLRCNHFLDNLSLSADEAWVAIDLSKRNLNEIFFTKNLDPNFSIPPFGFLLITKIFLNLFGNTEYILRLFPLIASIASIFIFRIFLTKYFSSMTSLLALTFFVFSDKLIFYSATLKQYSSDVLTSILMLSTCIYFFKEPRNRLQHILLGIIGTICITISHPTIFILTGITISQLINFAKTKKREALLNHLLTYSIWLLGFLIIYFFSYSNIFTGSTTIKYQNPHFLYLDNLPELFNKLLNIFSNPIGLKFSILALITFFIGAIHLFKKDWQICLGMLSLIGVTIIVSLFRKYPFYDRFLVFLIPIYLVFISAGISFLINKKKLFKIVGYIITATLLAQPLSQSIYHIFIPRYIAQSRPHIEYIHHNAQPRDIILLNNSAQYSYHYYRTHSYHSQQNKIVNIVSDRIRTDGKGEFLYIADRYFKNSNKIYNDNTAIQFLPNHPRIWILISEMYPESARLLDDILNENGEILEKHSSPGSTLYLYSTN